MKRKKIRGEVGGSSDSSCVMAEEARKSERTGGSAGSDVTGNKTEVEALRESEKRYRLLTENLSDVIWTIDLNSLRFTYVSPSIERLLGYSAEEMVAQGLKRILTPAFFRVAMRVLEEELALEDEEGNDLLRSRTIELTLLRKDGTVVSTETGVTLLRDPDDDFPDGR